METQLMRQHIYLCAVFILFLISPLKVNIKVLYIINCQDLKSALTIAQAPFKVPRKAENQS